LSAEDRQRRAELVRGVLREVPLRAQDLVQSLQKAIERSRERSDLGGVPRAAEAAGLRVPGGVLRLRRDSRRRAEGRPGDDAAGPAQKDKPQGEDLLDPRQPVLERMGAQVVTSKTNPSTRMARIAHPSPSPPSLRRSRLRMTSRLSDS